MLFLHCKCPVSISIFCPFQTDLKLPPFSASFPEGVRCLCNLVCPCHMEVPMNYNAPGSSSNQWLIGIDSIYHRPLAWLNSAVCSKRSPFASKQDLWTKHLFTVVTCLIRHPVLASSPSFLLFPPIVSWEHLINKPILWKSSYHSLLLGKPQIIQIS